ALSVAAQQNSMDPLPVDIGCETGAEVCEDVVQSMVSTSGTATVKVNPDKVTVTIGVETDGLTAQEAATKNAELMEKVLAALKDIGITDDQISTNWYSVYPTYEYRSPPCIEIYPQPPECSPKNEITGYRASNSLSVTMDADADVGKVIDAAVAAGANNVSGAYFFVSEERQQEIRDGLIEKAIDNARSRADKAAAAVEMEVSGVKSINLNDVYFPVFYKEFALDANTASTPILPGQQQITMTVQVTFFMS
ncbi:MAG: SIMPL domain-containing protein, partial [Nitrososphaera sp.]